MLKTKRVAVLLSFALQFLTRPIRRHRDFIRDVILTYRHNDNNTVLDFGCGSGIFSAIFKENENIRYVGVDNDIVCLKFAKGIYGAIAYLNADERLCFKKESFDFVILNNVLHHLKDDAVNRLFAEIVKVMKKSAFLLIVEMKPKLQQKGGFFKLITGFEEKIKGIRYVDKDFLAENMPKNFEAISNEEISMNFTGYIYRYKSG